MFRCLRTAEAAADAQIQSPFGAANEQFAVLSHVTRSSSSKRSLSFAVLANDKDSSVDELV